MSGTKIVQCARCFQIYENKSKFEIWGRLINNEIFDYGSDEKYKLKTPLLFDIVCGSRICRNCLKDINYELLKDFPCHCCHTYYQRISEHTAYGCATIIKEGNILVPAKGSKYYEFQFRVIKLPKDLVVNNYICDICIDKYIKENLFQIFINRVNKDKPVKIKNYI